MAGGYSLGGALSRSTFVSIDGTSQPVELLVRIQRGAAITLGAQLEGQLRAGIRSGSLRPGSRLPSTRDLAHQLGISRRIVVETIRSWPRRDTSKSARELGLGSRMPRLSSRAPCRPPRHRQGPRASTSGRAGRISRLSSSRVASIGAPRAVDDERRRARLRRPARCRRLRTRSPRTSVASAGSSRTPPTSSSRPDSRRGSTSYCAHTHHAAPPGRHSRVPETRSTFGSSLARG